jgi:hypothetical protein
MGLVCYFIPFNVFFLLTWTQYRCVDFEIVCSGPKLKRNPGVFDRSNGGGFLDEIYPSAYVYSFSTSQPFTEFGVNHISLPQLGAYHLTDLITQSAKAIWDFEGIYCTSRHIPHVKFAGLIHPGILGCAPSAEVSHIIQPSSWSRSQLAMNRFWQRGISAKENSLQQINSTGLWLNHPMPRMFSMHVFKFIFHCLNVSPVCGTFKNFLL